MDWRYMALEDTDLSGSLLVAGLPSLGMVGPVAARFLVDHLEMRVIGTFQGEALPPSGVAWHGVVTGPVQVYATDLACGLDGRCDRLLVLNSDVSIAPDHMMALAAAIGRWAADAGVQLIAGLDGYDAAATEGGASIAASGAPAGNLYVASNHAGHAITSKLGGRPLHGQLSGFTFALLAQAPGGPAAVPTVALLAPVAVEDGDARAAAALLHAIAPLLPNLALSLEQLDAQASALERDLRRGQDQNARALHRLQDQVDRSYA